MTFIGIDIATAQKQEWHCIYQFEGDRLQIAYRKKGPAPEKFESTPGSGITLFVFQKMPPNGTTPKSPVKSAPPDSAPVEPEAKPTPVNPAAELGAMLGEWKVIHIEKGEFADLSWASQWSGVKPMAIDALNFHPELVGILSFAEGSNQNFYYSIDPNVEPKTIDIFLKEPPAYLTRAMRAQGIFKINGNQMKVCLAGYLGSVKSEQRPKDFQVEPRSGAILLTLERFQSTEDEKNLLGDWFIADRTKDGQSVREKELRETARFNFSHQVCFPPNSIVSDALGLPDWRTGSSSIRFFYMLDMTAQPKTIKFICYNPNEKIKYQFSGIYQFDGDGLQIAYRKKAPAPKKFESTPGSDVTLLVLKRNPPKS
jgi:uncharacterized protein (TIGR03067 family)